MSKYRYALNLQFFADDAAPVDSGVEDVPAAGEQMETNESSPSDTTTGVKESDAAGQIKDEKDFAAALKAREQKLREQLEKEYAERYKDYDILKKATEYLQKTSGINDIMTLKETIELEELRERAERENLPVSVLKRLDELEAKAARVEQLEREREEQARIMAEQEKYKAWRSDLEKFASEKGVDADKLQAYMYENQIGKFEAAYKAMRAEELEKQLENAKKEGVKEFLSAKGSIPTVEGKTSSGTVLPGPAKTLADASKRAMQRLMNWGQMEG